MVLALKNGSSSARPATPPWRAGSARSSGRSCGCPRPPARDEVLRAAPRSTIRSPDATGRRRPPPRAARLPRSAPRAGARPGRAAGTDSPPRHSAPTEPRAGRPRPSRARPECRPAVPENPATPSGTTGSPKSANRAGSPLALRMRPSHCGASRAITRSRIVRPPIWRIGLSPPPIRRARPPASSTPAALLGMPSRSPPLRLCRADSSATKARFWS